MKSFTPRWWLLAIPGFAGLIWGLLAILYTPVEPAAKAGLAAASALVAVAVWKQVAPRISGLLLAGLAAVLIGVVLRALPEPSNDRNWVASHAQSATTQATAAGLRLRKVRNFRYASSGEVTRQSWEERSYDPARLDSVWFGISRFGSVPGVGHVFVSFGFDDGRYLAVSVEARREQHESYDPLRGLFRAYETIYVIGDERDIVAVRSNVWHDDVHLYPVRATREAIRGAFVEMMARADALAQAPEFYDTLFNSCSSNLARHANRVAPGLIPRSLRVVFAGFSDGLAHELDLFDYDGTLAQARARFRVNERAAGDVDAGDFSARIRFIPAGRIP